jgi:hypothetical protein
MKTTNTAARTFAWEVQCKRGEPWRTSESAVVTTAADPVSVARAALAGHLMTVDHASDLDHRRAVIQLALAPSESIVVTEGDLEYYLRNQDYYPGRPALCTVLPKVACGILPAHLRAELDRVGPPPGVRAPVCELMPLSGAVVAG